MPALRDIRFLVVCLLFAATAALSAQTSGLSFLGGLTPRQDIPDDAFFQSGFFSDIPPYLLPSIRLETARALAITAASRDASLSSRQARLSGQNAFGNTAKGIVNPDQPGTLVYSRPEAELAQTLHPEHGHGKDRKKTFPHAEKAASSGLAARILPTHSVAVDSGIVFVLPGIFRRSSVKQSDAPRAGPATRAQATEERERMPAPSC